MTPIYEQIRFFLNTIAMGLIVGIVFDFYRVLRQKARWRKWATGIADLLLCLFFTGLVFFLLLLSNWGEVRVYVFIGLALGLAVYFRYLNPTIFPFWQQWLAFLVGSGKLILRLIRWLLKAFKGLLHYPLALVSLILFSLGERLGPLFTKPKRLAKGVIKKLKGFGQKLMFWRRSPPPL